jgi:hypothetical protein
VRLHRDQSFGPWTAERKKYRANAPFADLCSSSSPRLEHITEHAISKQHKHSADADAIQYIVHRSGGPMRQTLPIAE